MPRRGKGKKKGEQQGPLRGGSTGDPHRKPKRGKKSKAQRRRELDKKKAAIWKEKIRAAIKAKAAFSKQAKEVDSYFKARHAELFDSPNLSDHFMTFEGASAVSVPKSAQMRNNLGPHLYPQTPTRNVNPKTTDTVMLGLARVLEAYINATPREAKLARETRRAIDDSLLRGRGFLRTGFDPTQEIVTSWYVSSRDVLIDPDATCWQDAYWIALRKVTPLWQAKREIKDGWRKKDLTANYRSVEVTSSGQDSYEENDRDSEEVAITNDMVEAWEIYSKMGGGQLASGFPDGHPEGDSDFVKVTISMGHEVPLYEGPWETPLYLDKDWPVEPLDYVETLDELWPESVMGQVIPLQRTIDVLTSLSLTNCKMRGKFVMFGDETLSPKYQKQIRNGSPAEYIPVSVKPTDRPVGERFKVMETGSAPPELAAERAYLEQQFEIATGLTPVVQGVQSGPQDRSAEAARQKGMASNARLGDMKARTEEFQTNVARHEALMARLELDPKEVEPFVPQSEIALFRVLVDPTDELRSLQGIGEIQVRGRGPWTLQSLCPGVANYYESEEEAFEAVLTLIEKLAFEREVSLEAMLLNDDLGNAVDPMTGERFLDPMAIFQTNPETGEVTPQLPEGFGVVPVSVEDVWADTSGISAKELARELSYELATGSLQAFNKDREIDTAETQMQQIGPVALQAGRTDVYNQLQKRVDDAFEVPQDKRAPEVPPPAPMPEGAPA